MKKLFILILLAFLIAGAGEKSQMERVAENIVSISVQSGAGFSTRWTIFCDIEHCKVSESFYYVLAAGDEYVVYVQSEDGEHSVVVQSIFDRAAYCMTYPLPDCTSAAVEPVIGGEITGDGSVIVRYLTGPDCTETEQTIEIP